MERIDYRFWNSLAYTGYEDEHGDPILGKMEHGEHILSTPQWGRHMSALEIWVDNMECEHRKKQGAKDKLMQFTGIRDSCEVKIYEGDILEAGHDSLEVFYDKKKLCWMLKGAVTPAIPLYIVQNTFKVIGNVCENPELLGEV